MILRRPYAWLVKHFKIIHAILLLGAAFLVLKTRDIVSFFGSYIKNGISGQEAIEASSKYIPLSLILVSLFMVILTGIIIYLLRYKNKSVKMYLFMEIFYIVYTGLLIWMTSFISDLGFANPGIQFISIIRDVFRTTIILNVIIIALCFVRAIGFDLKKFDFKKDLLDLGVTEEDNEEYEFELKVDRDKVKARINRGFRYTKYFYKENKFIFRILACIAIFLVLSTFVKIITSIEKIYKENQYFETNSLKMKVLNSYKTRTNTFGTKLNTQYFYIITKIEFNNKQGYDYTIDDGEIRISYGDRELVSPTKTENSKLSEFGVNYFSQVLKPYESRIFNFIFEIPMEYYYDDDFVLKYLYDIYYKKNELHYDYKKVSLNPKTFNEEAETVATGTLGNEMSFEGSLLGNTKIKINEVKLSDSFYYNLIKCNSSGCSNMTKTVTAKTADNFDLTLMRLNYSIDFDYDVLGKKYTNDLFISKFGTIRFEINGKEYNNRLDLVDVTPFYTKDYSIIQVRDKLKKADKIYLDFKIRDKIYTYVIKDNTTAEEEKEGE